MTAFDGGSDLEVAFDGSGTRVEVRSGIGFVVPDALAVQSVSSGAADFHASLRCASWPVQLTLYRGRLPTRGTGSMASSLCASYAEKRAKAAPEVSPASPAQLQAWGVDAAARAVYALRAPEGGFDHEESLYLLVGTVGWRVVTRFDAAGVTPAAWHEFSTRLDATLGREGARAAEDAPVESFFVDGRMGLKAEAAAYAEELGRRLGASEVPLREIVGAADALREVVFGPDPPDARVDPPSLDPLQRALARVRTPALREALDATLQRVATWRDLRGAQIFLEHLARARGADRPAAVRCDCGAVLHPGAAATAERSLDLEAYRSLRRELDALAPAARSWAHPASRPARLLLLQCTLDPLQPVVTPHLETCPVERGDVVMPFGARKAVGGARGGAPPPEIDRIRRGGFTEFVGLFINDGLARWCGFDLDQGLAVRVERFAGSYLASAPTVSAPSAARYGREARGAGGVIRDVVTYRELTGKPLAQLVTLSNVLWQSPQPMPPFASDVYNRVELRDGPDVASLGGACILDGPAGRLARVLSSLFA